MAKKLKNEDKSQIAETFQNRPDGHYSHRLGNGYTKRGNRYYLSPGRTDALHEINAKHEAAQLMLDSITRTVRPLLEMYSTMRANWWTSVLEDIQAPSREGWKYGFAEDGLYIQISLEVTNCLGCGVPVTTTDEYVAHVENCKEHPLGQRIAALTAELSAIKGKEA